MRYSVWQIIAANAVGCNMLEGDGSSSFVIA
jgi:hypothetical protein